MLKVIVAFWTWSVLLFSQSDGKASRRHHKLLLVSIDGCRWDYPDRAAHLPSFKYLKENGVKAKYLQGIFPTQTSPNHFTMATGLYSESHGVVHNCYYNITSNRSLPYVPSYYETMKINEWWDNGAEPIWITAVNQGLRSGGYLYPGSYANISGVGATLTKLKTASTPSNEAAWKERIDETIAWFTDENLDMIALHFSQPDRDNHRYSPDDDHIINVTLPAMDRTIMYLLEQVDQHGLKDTLNIILVSDHGFETVDTNANRSELIELSKYVNRSYIDFQFAYGPLGLVEPTPDDAEYVAKEFRSKNSNMKVYLKDEIPERWHYKNNKRIPSIVVVAEPGYDVYPIFPGFHPNKGDHGYDNALENMRAIYYSIGPSFKKGYEIEGFESVNIYPLMCHLLGLKPAPNNGSLDVLYNTLSEDVLYNTFSGDAASARMSVLFIISSFFLSVSIIEKFMM